MTPQKQGRDFEKELAKEFGLTQVPGSGSVWHSKLDLIGKGFRWSLKYTEKSKNPIDFETIDEAMLACYGAGGDGSSPIWVARIQGNDFIMMLKEDFKSIQQGDIKLIEEEKPHIAARKARARQPELLREEN